MEFVLIRLGKTPRTNKSPEELEVKRFLIYTLGQQLRTFHKETNKTTENSQIYGDGQISLTGLLNPKQNH